MVTCKKLLGLLNVIKVDGSGFKSAMIVAIENEGIINTLIQTDIRETVFTLTCVRLAFLLINFSTTLYENVWMRKGEYYQGRDEK